MLLFLAAGRIPIKQRRISIIPAQYIYSHYDGLNILIKHGSIGICLSMEIIALLIILEAVIS